MQYRPEIDGLRAVAILAVTLFHAKFSLFSGGFAGVDVFFVISGYLITSIILSDLIKGTFSMSYFYERRARRILPALFFVMFVTLPIAYAILTPRDIKEFSQSLIYTSTFSSNIFFYFKSGYFDVASELKPLLHMWSLSVEEQYYLIFPVMLLLLYKYTSKKSIIIVLLAIVSLVFSQYAVENDKLAAFFLLPMRAWELLTGALVAIYLLEYKSGTKYSGFMSLFGFLLVISSFFLFSEDTPFPGFYAVVPVLESVLIILFASEKNLVGRILSNKVFVGMGLISYSAYLWHQPVLSFSRHLWGGLHEIQLLFLLILSVFLAYFSWKYVEKPFRDGKRYSKVKIFKYSLLASLFFILVGAFGYFSDGFFSLKMTDSQQKILNTAIKSPMREICHENVKEDFSADEICQYANKNGSWAVFGDSHGVEIAFSLSRFLEKNNDGVFHFTYSGCEPSFGRELESDLGCSIWTQNAINYINNNKIKNIVVSYRINQYLFGKHKYTYPDLPNLVSDSNRSQVWKSYLGVLQEFLDNDKNVYLVLQAPELPKSINKMIAGSYDANLSEIKGVKRNWWNERNKFVYDRLSEIPDKVRVIDPATLFCNNNFCKASEKGIALYFDDNHVSLYGSNLIANEIFAEHQ